MTLDLLLLLLRNNNKNHTYFNMLDAVAKISFIHCPFFKVRVDLTTYLI